MNSEKLTKEILSSFNTIKKTIQSENGIGFFDINKSLESLFLPVLNQIYGTSLSRSEFYKKNFPAVDLLNHQAKLGGQVTTTVSQAKINHTVEVFNRNPLTKNLSRLFILMLGAKTDFDDTLSLNDGTKPELVFWEDLETAVSRFPPDVLNRINSHLKAELERPDTFAPPVIHAVNLESDHGRIDDHFSSGFFATLDEDFLSHTVHLFKELLRNNSTHGRGKMFSAEFSPERFVFRYEGNRYELESLLRESAGKEGQLTLRKYFEFYDWALSVENSYDESVGVGEFVFLLKKPLAAIKKNNVCIVIDRAEFWNFEARRNCDVVTFDLTFDPRLKFLNGSDFHLLTTAIDATLENGQPVEVCAKADDYRLEGLKREYGNRISFVTPEARYDRRKR